ncbi:MAG TPA: PASTA domain-containing protein [Thiothrix sp.]|nr:PASTA domain-containing protein [Thiothrix sp.]
MSRIIKVKYRILTLVILTGVMLSMLTNTAYATPVMPNVLGKPLESARQQLYALGITISSIKEQQTHNGHGQIIVQTPLTGAKINANTPVHLIVARPLKKLTYTKVPNLKDLSLEQVKVVLAEAHLKLGNIKKHRIKTDEGVHVLYQTPVVGERRVINTYVDITLSDPIPRTKTHVKLKIEKKQLTIGESLTLKAEIGNPIQGEKPKYSFNINGKIIPSDTPSLDYTFDKAGRCIVIANVRYGKRKWLSSPAKLIEVTQRRQVISTIKESNTVKQDKPIEKGLDKDQVVEKWQKPKAVIHPKSIGVKHGQTAVFQSRSTANRNTSLSLTWKTPRQQFNQRSKIRIDTHQLKAGKVYTIRLRVEDERGLVDTTKAHLHIAKIKKPRNEQGDMKQLIEYNRQELGEISFNGSSASTQLSTQQASTEQKSPKSRSVANTPQESKKEDREPVAEVELQKQLMIARQQALKADQNAKHVSKVPEKIRVSPDADTNQQANQTDIQANNNEIKAVINDSLSHESKHEKASTKPEQNTTSIKDTAEKPQIKQTAPQASLVTTSQASSESPAKIQQLITSAVSEIMALPNEANKLLLLTETVENNPLAPAIPLQSNKLQIAQNNNAEKAQGAQQISRGNIALRLSTHQLLVGGTIQLNVEPVSTLASEEFELVVEQSGDQQNSEQFVLPTINAKQYFPDSGKYSLYANVMTDQGWVQSPTVHIRVWPLWLPMLIVILVGALLLLHLRLKNRKKKACLQKNNEG